VSFVFELSPAAYGAQGLQPCGRIIQIAVKDHAPAYACAQSANRASTVKFAADREALPQRNVPIGGGDPTIHISCESPFFPIVVAAKPDGQRLSGDQAAPLHPGRIAGLAGSLSGSRKAQELIPRRVASKGIEEPARQS